jgi:hypothetical protein
MVLLVLAIWSHRFWVLWARAKIEDESRTTQIVLISITKSVFSIFDAQFSS